MRMFVAVVIAAWSAAVFAAPVPLTPDNTKVEFKGTAPKGSHVGGFKTVSGSVDFTGTDVATTKIKVEIVVDSLYADDTKLAAHLKSPDFFDVKKFPKAAFTSVEIKPSATPGEYTVSGPLSLHGVTKPVTFPAKISIEGGVFKLDAKFKVQREEFGMAYGKGQIDNDVSMTVSVTAK